MISLIMVADLSIACANEHSTGEQDSASRISAKKGLIVNSKRYTKHFIEKLMKLLIENKRKLPRSVQTFGDTRIQFIMDEPE